MLIRSLALTLILAFTGPVPQDTPILVSAAISLTDALEEIARAYAAGGGGAVRFNFAGSNVLGRQIAQGAPADLFISADIRQMDLARAAGAVDAPEPLLANRLVVVTPSGQGGAVRTAADLLRVRRIAVGDPVAVPAGVYAREYLHGIGLWDALQPRLVPLANVRAALVAAESGGVDAAIVYQTDAAVSKKVDVAFVVTGPSAPRITYPAALVTRSVRRDAARRFLDYLRGPEAVAIFRKHGFCAAPGSAAPHGVREAPCAVAVPEPRSAGR